MIAERNPPQDAPRILLVDDDAIVRDFTAAILEPAGYVVALAVDGAEAVEAVRHARYDMVLMDLDMPVMDGFAASRAIRALGDAADRLPLVAITARPEADDLTDRWAAGIDGSLMKPFSAQALLTLVGRWTAQTTVAASAAKADVWDQGIYRELAGGLGSERTADLLLPFEQHLTRALLAPKVDPDARAHLGREAHDLVSCAGMLGFQELVEASRTLMAMPEGAAWDAAVDAFREAAGRVLALLRQRPQPT